LKETFFYKEPKSELMQDSSDAKQLGLTSLSTVDIMRLKSQLETIMWSAFGECMEKSKAGDWLIVNAADTCFCLFMLSFGVVSLRLYSNYNSLTSQINNNM